MLTLRKGKGRPLFDGKPEKQVLQKLEDAFMVGATDQEACICADISPSALYEYQKKHPEFLERKQALKNMPTLKAKRTIVSRLGEDTDLAKWWLTKRAPREFGSVLDRRFDIEKDEMMAVARAQRFLEDNFDEFAPVEE